MFKDRAKDKVDRKTAQSMCEKEVIYSFGAGPEHCIDETQRRLIQHLSQGGFIAEVTTKKEMVNLQLVFENKARTSPNLIGQLVDLF